MPLGDFVESINSSDGKIRVWCLLRDQFAHVKPVEQFFGPQAEFIYNSDWLPEKMLSAQPDIILCVNEFQYEIAKCIHAARENGIPSLLLQDGILEWRNQYENPLFGHGGGAPQHQPVLSNKIACLGFQSARHIAAWGNYDKVEVTGMPRLDGITNIKPPTFNNKPKRILVMTAKKPWLDDAQKEITLLGLFDLKEYLAARPDVDVVWRLTKNVSSILKVENNLSDLSTQELSTVLGKVDAVISTFSTAILEAMLLGRPVCVLDYHNTPQFINTAWSISCKAQMEKAVNEILDPPKSRMVFQQVCLSDALWINSPASRNVAELISQMVSIARDCQVRKVKLEFPADMVKHASSMGIPEGKINLEGLYPDQKIYSQNSVIELQASLVRAEAENSKLKSLMAQRNAGYWMVKSISYIYRRIISYKSLRKRQ